jgi:ABC-type transport system involved in multi-copper enzyme maturation permease subunit
MNGLIRAEWLRFRKRRSLQVIVVAIPILITFFFIVGFASIERPPPPFDAAAVRARLLVENFGGSTGTPEFELLLDEAVEQERFYDEQNREQIAIARSSYAFPQSVVTVFSFGTFVLFALILLSATTIGDDFGWGTIRTTLLASSHRVRLLLVRFAALAVAAIGILGALLLLGVTLPLALGAFGAQLIPAPAVNVGALGVLIVGLLETSLVVIAFAAMATLLVRSGGLTLVVMLVYVVVEAAILALLLQFDAFKQNGPMAWLLDAFPVRGLATLTDVAGRAAAGIRHYEGEVIRNLGDATVPMVALLIWGTLFGAIAFRRFARMDIAE